MLQLLNLSRFLNGSLGKFQVPLSNPPFRYGSVNYRPSGNPAVGLSTREPRPVTVMELLSNLEVDVELAGVPR